MDKFYFPMETMRITQNPYGSKSHHPHNTGTPKDYPIDCAGVDGNRSAIFAPTEMKVTAIKYCTTNTIWLVSTHKVDTPTFKDIVFMTCTHWNDDDPYVKKLKVGSIIPKGDIICLEGTDGATANHIHICCGKGYSDNWVKNSNKKWVMVGDNKPPEQVMYRYTKFTTRVMDNGGLKWVSTDTDTEPDFLPDRGYFTIGDSGYKVELIDNFLAGKVEGNYFGTYTKYGVIAFQHEFGLEEDGNIGPITLGKMKEQGLNKYIKLPSRGYFKVGDSGSDITTIDSFLAAKVRGDYYGNYTSHEVMALQTIGKQDGVYDDVIDGNFGPKTLAAAEYYGFKK